MLYEVMKGSTRLVHMEAFDTMVWRGRTVSCPRLLVGIPIHYATCVNQTSLKYWDYLPQNCHLVRFSKVKSCPKIASSRKAQNGTFLLSPH